MRAAVAMVCATAMPHDESMSPDDEPTLDEIIAWSLDAEPHLLPHLPALFADLEELGARSTDVLAILANAELPAAPRILDLGCGKGAVARALLEAYPESTVHGIDGLAAFVDHAESMAEDRGFAERCLFAQADVRRAVLESSDYDLVCFLALGDTLGATDEAIAVLRDCVKEGGYILIDDAYLRHGVPVPEDIVNCFDHETTLELLAASGDEVVGERIIDGADAQADYLAMTAQIAARAAALVVDFPADAEVLEEYVARQQTEVEVLTGPLVGAMWLLRRGS